jgi:hypothetical protein
MLRRPKLSTIEVVAPKEEDKNVSFFPTFRGNLLVLSSRADPRRNICRKLTFYAAKNPKKVQISFAPCREPKITRTEILLVLK